MLSQNVDILKLASSLARHASGRQELVARNVANADTPGYRARDLADFRGTYEAGLGLRQTREGHMAARGGADGARTVLDGGQTSPNGNDVSIEGEMVRATDIKRQHDMALAVYKGSLDLLRTALGRGR